MIFCFLSGLGGFFYSKSASTRSPKHETIVAGDCLTVHRPKDTISEGSGGLGRFLGPMG